MTYTFVWFLAIILCVDAVIVGVVLRGNPQAAWIVPLVIVLPLLLAWMIMRLLWTPVARRFPAQPIGDGAARKLFQSAWLGRFGGMNHCLIIHSDDAFIHLQLMPPFGWLAPGTASIPRAELASMVPARFGPGMVKGFADGFRVSLPKWAVER